MRTRTRAEITPKVGVAHKFSQCSLKYPKHPPTVNPGSAPEDCMAGLAQYLCNKSKKRHGSCNLHVCTT